MTTDVRDYNAFLVSKRLVMPSVGKEPGGIHPSLFPFQADLVRWAMRKGRAALFADTGLGKTRMQVEWARLTGEKTIIFAPLSVARQTVKEAASIGVDVIYARNHGDTGRITITNYELLDRFDAASYGAVVLDESSILKGLAGKTRQRLTAMFASTRYRLCCTATPAPNDITEIANHAEFLGVMSRADMLASFFVHDDEGWRLKGHATDAFYRWLASWSMAVKRPSDIGYEDDGFVLPTLDVRPVFVQADYVPEGQLFHLGLSGVQDRHRVRRLTMAGRVDAAMRLVAEQPGQWILWCGLNEESKMLTLAIPGAVEIEGADSPESKADAIEAFQAGRTRVIVTKTKIGGFGLNLQNCHQMIFVGLSDSWESYYQAVRRCWRYGQREPVTVRVVLSDAEAEIWENVQRKEKEANVMSQHLIANVQEFERAELGSVEPPAPYREDYASGDGWELRLGDSAKRIAELDTESVGLSVFSPPFLSLYTYSPSERDMGNSRTTEEFLSHFGYLVRELLRVTRPGRLCCVHVEDVPAMLVRDGYIGLKDFPGMTVRAFEEEGWIFHGRVTIDKNPQPQAIRVRSKGVSFGQLEKDSSWMRPALGDYILLFRKPGESEIIEPDCSRQEWILWARPVWYAADYLPGTWTPDGSNRKAGDPAGDMGIRETETLNAAAGRENGDERHIAPLQLGTIERCVRLWSNRGDVVLDPFAGIGSTGYVALRHGRAFTGCELKESYWRTAVRNLEDAELTVKSGDLFTWAAAQ